MSDVAISEDGSLTRFDPTTHFYIFVADAASSTVKMRSRRGYWVRAND